MSGISRLYNTIKNTKDLVKQQSKQRRGGVTDLYALDYTEVIDNDGENPKKTEAQYRVNISGDLDRFQRWFIKFIVVSDKQGGLYETPTPVSDVHLYVHAENQTNGKTADIDLTPIFKHKWKCNWIGDDMSGEGIFPNSNSMEGYDLMDAAWYLDNDQRSALYSSGEKIFTIKALGQARITLRSFLKFSHIN